MADDAVLPVDDFGELRHACRLSRVCAFAGVLAACVSLRRALCSLRSPSLLRSWRLRSEVSVLAAANVSMASICVASERCAYQMSMVPISANSAIASR